SSPKTPLYSPKPTTLMLSPGQASVASRLSIDPPKVFQGATFEQTPPDLYDVPEGTLSTWGFLINRRLKCFICMSCHIVILPSHLPSHITKKHKDTCISVDKSRVQEIAHQEGLLSSYPDTPVFDQIEFQGLGRSWGHCCPFCPAMYSHSKDVLAHCHEAHDLEVEAEDLPSAWMQRLSEAPQAKAWFRIIPRSLELCSPSANYLISLRKELNSRPPLPASHLDHRHL
ncbi:hypothetical protein BD414DRAFT_390833, partial [Trametes punicea]